MSLSKYGISVASISVPLPKYLCLPQCRLPAAVIPLIGSIEVGKKADLAILDLNTPSLTPRNNLIAGLSYSANGSEVDTVIINGQITIGNLPLR